QTLNPKTDRWNKPKKSTYSAVVVMGKQENGHIKHAYGISKGWSDNEAIERVLKAVGEDYPFNENQKEQIRICKAINNTNKHIKVSIVHTTNMSEAEREARDKGQTEQKEKIGKRFAYEYHKLGRTQ
ncbi:hypothetical protein LCGC14_3039870, partial [marine sediment metagenome]